MIAINKLRSFFQKTRVQFWVLFIVLILIRFLPFFQGKTLVYGDNYSLVMPDKIFAAQWLREGVLPLWNPYVFSGLSTVMLDANQMVLYPSTLLFVVFSPAIALNLTVVAHLCIAYAGMYLLAKHWFQNHGWGLVAGVLWMLSTQVTGSINNLVTLQSMAYLPLVCFFGLRVAKERVFRLWFALVVLLQFFGGYPQHVLYSVLLAMGFSAWQEGKRGVWWRWIRAWAGTGLLTIGVTAAFWLPFIQATPLSTRFLQSEAQAVIGSFSPPTIVKFIAPYFFDNPAAGYKWGPAWSVQPNVGVYITWLGLLAIGSSLFIRDKKWARERWFFSLLTAVSFAIALGEHLPGFSLLQKIIPLFRVARSPSTMLMVTNLVLVLWAVRGMQQWVLNDRSQWWLRVIGGGVGLISAVMWWWTSQHFDQLWYWVDRFASYSLSQGVFHTLERDEIILLGILKNIVFNSIFFIAALWIFGKRKQALPLFLLAGVIGLDMIFNTHGQFFFAPNALYDTNSQNAQQLRQLLSVPSTGFSHRILTRNFNAPYTDYGSYGEALTVRAPFSDSFINAAELTEFQHPQALRDGFTPNWNAVFRVPVVNGYTTMLPADYDQLWRQTDEARINSLDFINPADATLDAWAVQYYFVDTWFKIEEDLSAFPVVGEFDRWQMRERTTALPRLRFADDSLAEVTLFEENPVSMRIRVENPKNEPGLIIADRFDSDWKAIVNGREVPVKNHQGMRLVSLEPGMNEVQLWYWPKWLFVGTIASAAAILVGIHAAFKKR